MFNVYHYYHWSNGHHVVVATSQPLAGGYTKDDEAEAAKVIVPVDSCETLEEAITAARAVAKAIPPHREFTEYKSVSPTVDGTAILFALRS